MKIRILKTLLQILNALSRCGTDCLHVVNPLSPNINIYILPTILLIIISYVTGWENLIKNQDIWSLVIISFILVTCMFDKVVIL